LPFKVPANKKLLTYFQKQPGTEGHEVTILVNGKEKQQFNLTEDKTIEVKL